MYVQYITIYSNYKRVHGVQQHVVNSNVPNYDNLIQMILYLLYGDL